MANTLFTNQPFVFCGLGTLTHTVASTEAGPCCVKVFVTETQPSNLDTTAASALSITVTQNGSTIYTSPTITPTQLAQQFKTGFLAASGDVINVTLSSASAIDNLLNTVKSTVYFDQGNN